MTEDRKTVECGESPGEWERLNDIVAQLCRAFHEAAPQGLPPEKYCFVLSSFVIRALTGAPPALRARMALSIVQHVSDHHAGFSASMTAH